MWATWANLGPRQGQNCAQIGPTSANNNNNTNNNHNNNHHNLGPRQGQTCAQIQQQQQQHQQPRAKTGANLRPNPGAGPAPVSLPEAFGGNRRLYTAAPPAADRLCPIPVHGCPIPVHARSTIIVVIYSVFCVWCSKNIVFYRVLWPSPSPGFILATLKNHGFFMVLGLRQGSGTDNWTSWRPWCQHRANIGQDVGYMGRHKG